jgi:hypothetical protein
MRASREVFVEEIHSAFYTESERLGVLPHWSKARAYDVRFHWLQDLERIEHVEDRITRADHLKCAAHLIFWLRRHSPVDNFAWDDPLSSSKEFMLKYGREYLAFDFGYRAAQVYEIAVNGRNLPDTSFPIKSSLPGVPKNDFVESVVHVLKSKSISPHALFILLKAIFLRP